MQRVNVGHKTLADYYSLIGRSLADEIRALAEPLKGRRMLHLSATAFGGGVAEIQYTLIPLLNDVGIEAEWRVIQGRDEFFDVTKTIHNALQGDPRTLTDGQRAVFDGYNQLNADALDDADEWDMIVVHDPQPVAIREFVADHPAAVGVALPHRPVRRQTRRCSTSCAAARATTPASSTCTSTCRAAGLQRGGDLAARDRPARAQEHGARARGRGLHRRPVRHRRQPADDAPGLALRPLEGPAGRDRRLPRGEARHPGMQLALVGSMAHDDPEGWEY